MAGRPKIKDSEKVKLVAGYFNAKEKKLIVNKYGSLTNAVRERILPELLQCG